jgi:addiction module HigA family antidote
MVKHPPQVVRRLPTDRPPTHPGVMLEFEFLQPTSLTVIALAERLGISATKLQRVCEGRLPVTPDLAILLEAELGVSAQFWNNLQQDWDAYFKLAN